MSQDTLTSVGLLQLDEIQTLERASKVLVERAEKNPPRLLSLQHPFFRLAPIERFLLTALHIEHWSYERIARILGVEAKLIAPWAWATRMKLCFQEVSEAIDYPRGPSTLGPSCPEYDISSPWTQRLMDDESGKRERLFLQNHLVACNSCRKSLELTRKMIFKIESLIPVKQSSSENESAANTLMQIWENGASSYRPIKTTFQESLAALFSKPSAQFALTAIIAACFLMFKKQL